MVRRAVLFVVLFFACKRDAPPTAGAPDGSVVADPAASAPVASSSPSSAPVARTELPAPPRTETTAIEDLVAPESADLENPMAKIGKTTV